MSGNSIGVGTLDLGADFATVAATLDGIVRNYFVASGGKALSHGGRK